MRRLLFLLALLSLTAVPVAHATGGSTYAGRCHLRYLPDDLFGSNREALAFAAIALYNADPAAGPVSAEVTCEVRGDEWYTPQGVSAHGTGAVVVAGRPWHVPWDASTVTVCTIVDFDDATPTAEECVPLTATQVPPPWVYEPVFGVLNEVFEQADPAACAAFAALAPGVPGVDVTADGDVYVAGEWVWDCAPYGDYAPPAGSRSTWAGGCYWDNLQTEVVTGNYQGNFTAAVVLSSPDAAANPVSGTVTCSVRVNGVDTATGTASGSGTGVIAFRRIATYAASELDVVEFCTRVEFADGTPTSQSCAQPERTQIPPQDVIDALDGALGAADATVCPVLAALHPTVPGVTAQGDVSVAGEPVWDCPPYEFGG